MNFLFAEHELDPRRQELRRGGEAVHIEPQVFDLLSLLIRHHDRIVSKNEILDTIWGGRIVSEAALSSRINAARKAVGDNGNEQIFIRTFHKRGFRFVGEVKAIPECGAGREVAAATKPSESHAFKNLPVLSALTFERGKPSIAVLPFTNWSGDPEHEYFAYGLTEDVIRLLGRNRWLKVLTRHSAYSYRGKEVDPREIGMALGVRYLVKGSVRKMGQRVRIMAELVSIADGSQLWSELYDFQLADIFDIQDTMAKQVAAVIEPELASIERELAFRKPPQKLDAWDCHQRGLWHLWAFTTPGLDEAEAWFKRAIELEPSLARAHAGRSYVYLLSTWYRDPSRRRELLGKAMEFARSAVALDERDAVCRFVLGRAKCMTQHYAAAIAELEAAIELNPSFAQGYFALAFTLVWCGREDEAIALIEQAVELSPRDPHLWTFYNARAFAHFSLGELTSAAFFARKGTRAPNATYWPFATLTASLGLLAQREEAEAAAVELLARKPDYNCSFAREDLFFCANKAFINRFGEGLARAGVPA